MTIVFITLSSMAALLAVGFVAYRHGYSEGYEQRGYEALELNKEYSEIKLKLKKAQESIESLQVKNSRQAHTISQQNYFNLGLCERCDKLKDKIRELETKLKQK